MSRTHQSDPVPGTKAPVLASRLGGVLGGMLIGVLIGVLIALLFVTIWMVLNPAVPHLETSDVFTHLSVARHLVRGEGFLTDITYPLSYAFDFARQLPQPLIHRGPAFPVLLAPVVALSPDDPQLVIRHVRWFQVFWLGLLTALGCTAWLKRANLLALGPWLVMLALSPLLRFAVDWTFVELPTGLLLLILWIRQREIKTNSPGWLDGFLAGWLALLRLDLLWLPLLWWLWARLELRSISEREAPSVKPPFIHKSLLIALLVMVLLNVPWAVRNTRLTGAPFFSIQGQAELAKDTRPWPGYSVYQQLNPQPVSKVLAEYPGPVLRKFVRGLEFHFRELGRLFPWAGLVIMALSLMVYLRGSIDKSPCPLRPNAEHPMTTAPDESPLGPLVVAAVTLILLIVQYSFFDHSLRHLLVLYPLIAWELSGLWGLLCQQACRRWRTPVWLMVPAAAVTALAVVHLTLQPLPGWEFAARQARQQQATLDQKTQMLASDPDVVPFVETSAAPWYALRPAVWDPQNEKTRQWIRSQIMQERQTQDP